MAALKANKVNVSARVQSTAFFSGGQVSSDKDGKQIIFCFVLFVLSGVSRQCVNAHLRI